MEAHRASPETACRRVIRLSGMVQGIGFRSFVHRLASRWGLHGSVRNSAGSLRIELEGGRGSLDGFLGELEGRPPPFAVIDELRWMPAAPRGERGFRIEASESGADDPFFIAPDLATCDDCLGELRDPRDRRHRYPFLSCTLCGPRLTVIRSVPYDRERTTLAVFPLCERCRAEYEDPADRRFHAQTAACPACGPRLELRDAAGLPLAPAAPLEEAARLIREGGIVAIKGIGGFHLACDARREDVVLELRRGKLRQAKPFAVMVSGLEAAERLCDVGPAERELLCSPRRPIVLLRRRPSGPIAPSVAPRMPFLGLMLPYTALHALLLEEVGEAPLVMTSANRSGAPIAFEDEDALSSLSGVARGFLLHDRPIHLPVDDSVTRFAAGAELPVRRSRGYAPQPIALPIACRRPALAVGGDLKAAFALARSSHAIVSHHLGDLHDYRAFTAYTRAIEHYERLFRARPEIIAHDLHPDYASTLHALRLGRERPGSELVAVQHHHAHMASCMAENGLTGPVLAVAFDGTGYGEDGTIWGGEFLGGDCAGFRRLAHLRQVAMPGGERAIREPWRMGLAHLADAAWLEPAAPGAARLFAGRVPTSALGGVERLLARSGERPGLLPLTSSAGRLFDALAAISGVCDEAAHEGQAAMELEGAALEAGAADRRPYPFEVAPCAGRCGAAHLAADTRPLVLAAAAEALAGARPEAIARRFHATLAAIIAEVCRRLREETGLRAVVLAGGVFLNTILLEEASALLEERGFAVFRHRRVPPNDGGLCLGQLAVAAARDAAGLSARNSGDSHVPGNPR
jgi:hydrogenase maturation protein HypF